MCCDRRILALLALAPVLVAAGTDAAEKRAPAPDQVVGLVIDLANEFRQEEGRNRVTVSAQLTEAARYMAGYMAESGRFGHEADGSSPATRARQHGYDYCMISENIAYRYSSTGFASRELAEGLVDGWKRSPGHRRNMLDADVTETGAAVARSARNGYYYAVQLFGRPTSQEITFRVANQSGAAARYRLGEKSYRLAPREIRTHRQCRAEEFRIALPGGEETLTPRSGERLAIVQSRSGEISLKRE